ncbi:PREDICTED: putative zinc finger A20 and AN1 domain-containing stress-associated protein 8 [Fragaria vesca subsp. vesca]|uniref:putative zinc finger A20 and AN1 domain-containing stress-associated protein 8 n=1 Tax=Fragaria vesca subsp. vesca TaxID=101020 RepID=UPI0002C308EA|nr:PREDICTED: putative zinc finger A20 and AN1 domain-containing stress-associated protein 8 [Fragaria vesca subsp. vesca]
MASETNMDPPLCAKGCGFYGLVAKKNMCSMCYVDDLKQELIAQSLKVYEELNNSVTNSLNSTGSTATARTRCSCCNKKLGLLGFDCKCGLVFCGQHRYPEKHSCCVDFKAAGREVLAMQNPLCKADKMESRI